MTAAEWGVLFGMAATGLLGVQAAIARHLLAEVKDLDGKVDGMTTRLARLEERVALGPLRLSHRHDDDHQERA